MHAPRPPQLRPSPWTAAAEAASPSPCAAPLALFANARTDPTRPLARPAAPLQIITVDGGRTALNYTMPPPPPKDK